MQTTLAVLNRKAIKAALEGNWSEAINLNIEILEKLPDDTSALMRLGRAYLQNQDFTQAKKIFKKILDADPINQVALKNFEQAKNKKVEKNQSGKIIIKEPGTTEEVIVSLLSKRIDPESLSHGDELEVNITKNQVALITMDKRALEIAHIENPLLIRKLYEAKKHDLKITASFIGAKEYKIKVLLRSPEPIFKAERQEVKPYVKRDSIEETVPELAE